MFICVASVIGTVLQQNDFANTYMDKFGPFWFVLFDKFSIWQVYNSWWFLLIMGFLVVSTSLCLIRNTPKFLRDARTFREYVRGSSLRAFPHRIEAQSSDAPARTLEKFEQLMPRMGYRYKVREDANGEYMLAAKKGSTNRLGFIFAHAAIVVICVGGLLDSELPVRMQVWFAGKSPIMGNMLISEVPESGRLPLGNPSFKSHLLLPEGAESGHTIINYDEGVLVQPMPFTIRLKEFIVDYYSTGMPSSFKSEVTVIDHETGDQFDQTIEVNEPLRYKGVTVYQSSLDDGGSKLELVGYPLSGPSNKTFDVGGTVGKATELDINTGGIKQSYKLDLTELKVINVENLAGDLPQPKPLVEHVAAVTGSAAGRKNDNLVNVGPSITYKLIGDDGQSYEFINYMLPMELDGSKVYLGGVRQTQADLFRYIRFPADEKGTLNEFMDLRAALANKGTLRQAIDNFAAKNATDMLPKDTLSKAALGAMESFARGGFDGIIGNVPAEDREKVLQFAVPMVQMTLTELRDIMREQTGREVLPESGIQAQEAQKWIHNALLAFANLPDYPAPVFLNIKSFNERKASVFQVTRSPGKLTVYLGCIFLVLGVFAMFYIRDRRVWIWIRPESGGSMVTAAMTSQRRNLDFTQEFNRFKKAFQSLFG